LFIDHPRHPMFSSAKKKAAAQELSQAEVQDHDVNAKLAAATQEFTRQQHDNHLVRQTLAHEREFSAALRASVVGLTKQLAGSKVDGQNCQDELATLGAESQIVLDEVALYRERLRRLKEKRAVLASASDSLRPLVVPELQVNFDYEGDVNVTVTTAGSMRWKDHSNIVCCDSTTPAILDVGPLHFVAAEAGKLVEEEQEMLRSEMELASAQQAEATGELQLFNEERSRWAVQARELHKANDELRNAQVLAAESLKAISTEVESLHSQMPHIQSQLILKSRIRDRLLEDCSKMQSGLGSGRRSVEELRGLTWQQVDVARGTVARTNASVLRAEEESMSKKKELAHLSAAHSQAIEREMAKATRVQVRLPAPDSTEVAAALQHAHTAAQRNERRETAARLEPPTAGGATGSQPPPALGMGPAMQGAMQGRPPPRASSLSLSLGRQSLHVDGESPRPPLRASSATRTEDNGSVAGGPALRHDDLGVIDKANPTAPQTLHRPTASAPLSARGKAGAAPKPGLPPLPASRAVAPAKLSAGGHMTLPLSARTPRSGLRETGQLVLGNL